MGPAAIYTSNFKRISVGTAVQDFFEIAVPSTAFIILLSAEIIPTADEINEQMSIDLKRFSGAYTSGSGGGTATPVPHQGKFSASSCTVERNNTTQATGGTATDLAPSGFALQGGWIYTPVPEERFIFGPSTACVLSLGATIGQATVMSGRITWAEFLA
jgi:hypothetical protein